MSTVVAQQYDISGNGGRKLVKLSNGWLVAVLIEKHATAARIRWYIAKNANTNPQSPTWEPLTRWEFTTTNVADVAMASRGTNVYTVATMDSSVTNKRVFSYNFDVLSVAEVISPGGPQLTVDESQTAVGNVSLTINQQGTESHAAWSSKNPTYPNSFNIRYAKGTIHGDGSVTWGAVQQVSVYGPSGNDNLDPTIVVTKSNLPVILTSYNNVSYNAKSIESYVFNGTSWLPSKTVYNGSSYIQSSPSAVIDKDGVIHVAWQGKDATDNTMDNIRYSKSTDGGVSWSAIQKLTNGNVNRQDYPSITTDKTGKIIIIHTGYDGSILRLKKLTNNGSGWSTSDFVNTLVATYPSALYDPTFAGAFGEMPPTVYMDTVKGSVEYIGTYTTNNAPTVILTSPNNNQTLYENDTLNIAGTAYDSDADQSVTTYYQINSDPRKVLATNVSQTQISLSKQLTFKGGKLFDGDTTITGTLAEGVAHTLKVWAVDSENGQSDTIERTFYVVPNRAPLLSVDTIIPSGIIDTDKFKISGTTGDPDANSSVKVNYRINGANPIEIYDGIGGAWEFEVLLAQLKVGENTIVVEVVDNYGAKTSKTIKLNKNTVKTPILQSVARYKISPPKGSARGVLIWVQRDEELDLKVELSMTLAGEQEQYISLEADPDNIVEVSERIVEDEYYHETVEPKDNIILKLTTSRANVNIDNKIYLILGVLE